MTCRHCGTEIASNALICYRCGSATTEPVIQPAARTRSAPGLVVYTVVLVLLLLVAAYLQHTTRAAAPRIMSWLAVGLAALLVVFRARRR